MNLEPIFIREQIIKTIREFFEGREFHEVVAPVLNKSIPLEPNIYPFTTSWSKIKASDTLYLSTSPEASLKKMIAKGIGNCFAIAKTFRNLEGQGSQHNPEFLMLEWYRENADYRDIMRECENLVKYISYKIKSKIQNPNIKSNPKSKIRNQNLNNQIIYQHQIIDLSGPWRRFSLIDLFDKYTGLDLEEVINDKKMIIAAHKKGYTGLTFAEQTEDTSEVTRRGSSDGGEIRRTWESLYNQIFLNEIEPKLPHGPFLLTDFPSRISPLCKPREGNPLISERFELYIAGMELGNGNTENTEYKSVEKVFQKESEKRKKAGELCPPIDNDFITALRWMKQSKKSYAGIGLGIDRLAMLLADAGNIKNVEPFCI